MRSALIVPFAFFTLVSASLVVVAQSASSPAYHQDVVQGEDGKPLLKITNDSESPIVAFVTVDFSTGLEGRTYYDVYTSARDLPIAPCTSITLGLGSNLNKVQDEVKAVVLEDGSSSGDPAWINAIFARRIRLYDRILSLHDFFRQEVGAGLSRETIIDRVRASKTEADKDLPDDDLRVVDDLVFSGAIWTLEYNRETNVDAVMQVLLKDFEQRAARLKHSQPGLDTLRARLAEGSDPSQPIIPPTLNH